MTIAQWVKELASDPELRRRVNLWLKRNPPPVEWQGTPDEWAYTEMIL